MTALLLWRLLKWIALILWTSGMWAVVNSPSQRQRLQSLYALLLWGFAGTWLAGWGLMKALDLSMKEAWISQSMLMGLISLAAAFGLAFQSIEGWFAKLSRVGVLGGLIASVGIMVFRGASELWPMVILASFLMGAVWSRFANPMSVEKEGVQDLVVKGFRWIAWAEGATVILLFGLYMPLKYGADIVIDGGTGLLGWAHGVFVIVYMISLIFTFKALSWSWMRLILGALASFLPFGTVIFERRVLPVGDDQKTK